MTESRKGMDFSLDDLESDLDLELDFDLMAYVRPVPLNTVHTPSIEKFWTWFQQHEEEISRELAQPAHAEMDSPGVNRLIYECSKVGLDLSLEVSLVPLSSRKKMVISANGRRDVFPLVEEMVDRSPELDGWIFIRFRQRQKLPDPVEIQDTVVDPAQVQFALYQDPSSKLLDIHVYLATDLLDLPSLRWHIGHLFLQRTLGEFDVATKLRAIEVHSAHSIPDAVELISIENLPGVFDSLFRQFLH